MATLQLEKTPPEDLEQGSSRLKSVYADAMAAVQARGIALPLRPLAYQGEMPLNIVTFTDDALGDLLSKCAAWLGFLGTELAKAEAERNIAKANLEFVRARVRLQIRAGDGHGKPTVDEAKDRMNADSRVLDAQRHALYTEAVHGITQHVHAKADQDWSTVSRRITQRGQDVERMRREQTVNGIPQHNSAFRR